MYEAGVFAALKELTPAILQSASKVYGASSGSIIATLTLCGCDADELKQYFFSKVTTSFWGFVPGGRMLKLLKNILNKKLPPNAHELVSGKLHIILTRLWDWRCTVVSEFSSKEDLIQAVICSCFIPLYFGLMPPLYRGVRYVDGELAMWQADFVSQNTITISALAGEYDICPKEGPAAFLNFQISDCILLISKRNLSRIQCLLQFPPSQVMDQFYIRGYQDTISYLKSLNKLGINHFDEDIMLSVANISCPKDERSLNWKPETRQLQSRASDSEDATEEKPVNVQAAN